LIPSQIHAIFNTLSVVRFFLFEVFG
jgi:hypothetical protein